MVRKKPCSVISAILALVSLGGCATLPENIDRPLSYAFTDTADTRLGIAFHNKSQSHTGQSGFMLLARGLDAFAARAVLAHLAERSIDVQYYLYHDDLIGLLFTDQLIKAAERGVRVRILVDDMDLAGRDLGVAAANSHQNIEIRIFNPFSRKAGRTSQFVTRMGSVTRRMHNKTFIVDNQAVILGGRNIGNEYFEADPDLAFADLDVLAIGPVVAEASEAFDRYWNSELAYPVSVLMETPAPEAVEQKRNLLEEFVKAQEGSPYVQALINSNLARKIRERQVSFHWGDAVIVTDKPEKILHEFNETEYHLAPLLAPYFKGVTNELIIFSPYFVPGKEGTAFLTELVQRGVQFPRVERCRYRARRLRKIPEGPSQGRRGALRDEQEAQQGGTQGT